MDAGGRFRVRNGRTVFLWSRVLSGLDDDGGEPIASFLIRLGFPTPEDATITRLAWDPATCDMREVFAAIDALRGDTLGARTDEGT